MAPLGEVACTPQEAVQRAQSIVGKGGQYILGTGDYRVTGSGSDLPWTKYYGSKTSPFYSKAGSDCAGFALCWAWKLRRHRPGFNVGPWASVSEDINCNSALEDGLHLQELYETIPEGACVQAGDVLVYPTIRVKKDGKTKTFIGHCGLVERVPSGFVYSNWDDLDIIQCKGPNGRNPGVVRTDGSIWVRHDNLWGKLEHRTRVVRPHTRS